jgi:hypothetical protein
VGLVEDQAPQFHEAKVVERGDQAAKRSSDGARAPRTPL